jgi:hypothetical protein
VTVGADDFLCTLLGPVDNVDITDGKVCLTSRRRKVTLPLAVEGKLVQVNPDLEAIPRLVNFSPYERGWLVLLKPEGTWQDKLISGPDVSRWFREEVSRLRQITGAGGKKAGASPDGQKWNVLRRAFFDKGR